MCLVGHRRDQVEFSPLVEFSARIKENACKSSSRLSYKSIKNRICKCCPKEGLLLGILFGPGLFVPVNKCICSWQFGSTITHPCKLSFLASEFVLKSGRENEVSSRGRFKA